MMEYCRTLMRNNILLSENTLRQMLTEQKTLTGKATGMCLGWFKGKLNKIDYFCHAGGGGGYYAEIRLYPDLRAGSVIMMNSSGMKDDRILDYLDAEFLNQLK